jgi:hypothetical protein
MCLGTFALAADLCHFADLTEQVHARVARPAMHPTDRGTKRMSPQLSVCVRGAWGRRGSGQDGVLYGSGSSGVGTGRGQARGVKVGGIVPRSVSNDAETGGGRAWGVCGSVSRGVWRARTRGRVWGMAHLRFAWAVAGWVWAEVKPRSGAETGASWRAGAEVWRGKGLTGCCKVLQVQQWRVGA